MVQKVLEANLHDSLKRLLCKDESIFIVIVPLDLLLLLDLVDGLELVGVEDAADVNFIFLCLVEDLVGGVVVIGRRLDKRIELLELLLLSSTDSSLEDLVLTGRHVRHSRSNHNFLISIHERIMILWLVNVEPFFFVDLCVDLQRFIPL